MESAFHKGSLSFLAFMVLKRSVISEQIIVLTEHKTPGDEIKKPLRKAAFKIFLVRTVRRGE
jgi:hypothetical protein